MTDTVVEVGSSPQVEQALRWIEHIRPAEFHSPNEKYHFLLADEIYRLRKLLKAKR